MCKEESQVSENTAEQVKEKSHIKVRYSNVMNSVFKRSMSHECVCVSTYTYSSLLKDARPSHSCVKKILLEDEQVEEKKKKQTVHSETKNNETESA